MSKTFNLYHYNDKAKTKPWISINEGEADTNGSSLTMLGYGYSGDMDWGQVIDQNFANLLENFAGKDKPANPTPGQIWYNSETKILSYYSVDAAGIESWTTLQTITVSTDKPNFSSEPGIDRRGHFWFQPDSANPKLYYWDGVNWILITTSSGALNASNVTVDSAKWSKQYQVQNVQQTLDALISAKTVTSIPVSVFITKQGALNINQTVTANISSDSDVLISMQAPNSTEAKFLMNCNNKDITSKDLLDPSTAWVFNIIAATTGDTINVASTKAIKRPTIIRNTTTSSVRLVFINSPRTTNSIDMDPNDAIEIIQMQYDDVTKSELYLVSSYTSYALL